MSVWSVCFKWREVCLLSWCNRKHDGRLSQRYRFESRWGNGHFFPSCRQLYLSSFSDTHTHTHTHTHTRTTGSNSVEGNGTLSLMLSTLPFVFLSLSHTHTHTHTQTQTSLFFFCKGTTFFICVSHPAHALISASGEKKKHHWKHDIQVHPVTQENQFHCTELYTHTHARAHTHTHIISAASNQVWLLYTTIPLKKKVLRCGKWNNWQTTGH